MRLRGCVGHAYTTESMPDEKSEKLERALYFTLNTFEEGAAISDRLAALSREHRHVHAVGRIERRG